MPYNMAQIVRLFEFPPHHATNHVAVEKIVMCHVTPDILLVYCKSGDLI